MFKTESLSTPLVESFWVWIRNLFFGDKCSLANEDECYLITRLAVLCRAIAYKTDIVVGSRLYIEDDYSEVSPPIIRAGSEGGGRRLPLMRRITNNDPANNVPQTPISSLSEARDYLNKCERICIDMCSIGGLHVAGNLLKVNNFASSFSN